MVDQYIVAFDPGESTGIALVRVPSGSPVELEGYHQIEGGVAGLVAALETIRFPSSGLTISEKFVPLSGRGHSLTLKSVEPLRVEGYLVGAGNMPDYAPAEKRWRRPDRQYFTSPRSTPLSSKKKRAHKFLEDCGFYVTGSMVGCKDANDARSAILHAISYAVEELEHKSTHDMIAKWVEENPI